MSVEQVHALGTAVVMSDERNVSDVIRFLVSERPVQLTLDLADGENYTLHKVLRTDHTGKIITGPPMEQFDFGIRTTAIQFPGDYMLVYTGSRQCSRKSYVKRQAYGIQFMGNAC